MVMFGIVFVHVTETKRDTSPPELLPCDDPALHLPNLLQLAGLAGFKQYMTFVCQN